MDTDAHCSSELGLREADESSEGSDVSTRLDLAEDETLTNTSRNGPGQLFVGEFRNLCHGFWRHPRRTSRAKHMPVTY